MSGPLVLLICVAIAALVPATYFALEALAIRRQRQADRWNAEPIHRRDFPVFTPTHKTSPRRVERPGS